MELRIHRLSLVCLIGVPLACSSGISEEDGGQAGDAQASEETAETGAAAEDSPADPQRDPGTNPQATDAGSSSPIESQPEDQPEKVAKKIPGFASYEHPLGFDFQHPKDWRVELTGSGIRLIPPDERSNAEGPLEYYEVTAIPAPAGVQGLDDPAVRQHLDAQISETLPFMTPSGSARAIPAAVGPGRVYTWKGSSPTGDAFEVRGYLSLQQSVFFGLVTVCEQRHMAQRAGVMEKVFSTCEVTAPDIDPRMVGVWYHYVYNSSGPPAGTLHASTTITNVLLPTGTLCSGSQTAIHGIWRRPDGIDYEGLHGIGESLPERGRWAGKNDKIYILWPDGGASAFSLYIQGEIGRREAMLTDPWGDKQLWTEYVD